jgi:adenylate cyclase
MAVFGVPRRLDDHAGRAVRCAIAMQKRQGVLNTEARRLDLPTPGIGIGINTRTVIAGTLGGAGRLDYTVLGDAVNIAQRLRAVAPAGEIFASAATIAQIDGRGAEPIGYKQLKGRREQVEVFRIPWASQ